MTVFCCPVCGKALIKGKKNYICDKNHSYDIAKNGYVNLLLPNQMNTKSPGDNKLMVQARTDFLNRGYYKALSDELSETVWKYCKNTDAVILDAGCGEGYYTTGVYRYMNGAVKVFGVDISKNALIAASKRSKGMDIGYAAGSLFHLPVLSGSCDILMTLFAPFCGEEFSRVLKNNGIMIMVIPTDKHLLGLKKIAYDSPYLNEVKSYELEGFRLAEKIPVEYNIELSSNEEIKNLFTMTPYYYKTSVEGSRRVSELQELNTEVGFEILVYKKK